MMITILYVAFYCLLMSNLSLLVFWEVKRASARRRAAAAEGAALTSSPG